MDPLGQFLFIANARGNTYVNRIDPSTGALAPVPGSPFAVGGDNSITADPTGRFVYMPRGRFWPTGPYSLCIVATGLDPTTGILTPIPGSTFNVQVSNVSDILGV